MSETDPLEDAISYIESQVDYIVLKMIEARKKFVECAEKVNDKLLSILNDNYTYRLGKTYDDIVKVEKTGMKQSDVYRPSIKLEYIGDKMPLYLPTGSIEVPSTPFFVYERPSAEQLMGKISASYIERGVTFELPPDVTVSPDPDYEDAYGKYYAFRFVQKIIASIEITEPAGVRFTPTLHVNEIQSFVSKVAFSFWRAVNIDGTDRSFALWTRHGIVKCKVYYSETGYVDNVEYDGVYMVFTTNYDNVMYNVFGKRFNKGVYEAGEYRKDLLLVDVAGRIHMLEVYG